MDSSTNIGAPPSQTQKTMPTAVPPGVVSRTAAIFKKAVKTFVGSSVMWTALSALRPSGVAVMTYHRVGVPEDPFPHLDIGVFRQHVEFAARHCDIIDAADLRKRVDSESPRRAVVLTFDDGFRGYYDHVYPFLKAAGVPAVVFPTTGLVDDPSRLLWGDMALLAVMNPKQRSSIALPWKPEDKHDLGQPTEKRRFLAAFKAHVKNVPEAEKASHMEWLFGAVGEPPAVPRQMLTWDEVRSTLPLTTYGGHSHTHPILARVTDDQLEAEIRLSSERITEETGREPNLFAYPNGRREDFDERSRRALTRHGFDTAFTTEPRINGRGTDWHAVSRIPGEAGSSDFRWLVSGLRRS